MNNEDRQTVSITRIDIPFWDIVSLLVTWTLAAIPALMILAIFYFAADFILSIALAMHNYHVPR
jgi:hypothetical protein